MVKKNTKVENTVHGNGDLDIAKLAEMLDAQEEFINIPDSVPMTQKLGVFQRLVTVPEKDVDYRQLLYMGMFRDERQANLACAAIAQALRYGATIQPIVDRIAAQSGINGARVKEIILGMNTQNINSNLPNNKLPFWKRKDKESIAGMD